MPASAASISSAVSLSFDAAVTTGRPAAKYEVSFEGSDMSVSEARWLTSRRSAAASIASHCPGACMPMKSTFARPRSRACRSRRSRSFPSPTSAIRTLPPFKSAAVSSRLSSPCFWPMFPPWRQTKTSSAQPWRSRVRSRLSTGSTRCVQLRRRQIASGRTPPSSR